MPTPSVYVDTRKQYNYAFEVAGIEKALVRKVNIPDIELAVAEHAHAGQINTTKTPGKMKIGEVTLEKAMPAMSDDTYFQSWLDLCKYTPRAQHTRTVEIRDLDLSNSTVKISGWKLINAWPSKIAGGDRDGMSESDAVIETITLQCDDVIRI